MGLKDFAKQTMKLNTKDGDVTGSSFPDGTMLHLKNGTMIFTTPDGAEEVISHDMVKCGNILAMGVIGANNNQPVYGTKYLCVLKDGRQAVITVGFTTNAQSKVERILF